jgi:hypothetical protein
MDRCFSAFLREEPHNILPSMAITSADAPVGWATQATKPRWNSIERCDKFSEMVVRRRAIAERQEPARNPDFLLAKPCDSDEGFCPGEQCE